jgi:density-regulated protein DRP1
VTTVFGLNIFGVDMKKAAKMFANKFACGASVAKNNQGLDEIVVQGDFSDEIHDLILANWPAVRFIYLYLCMHVTYSLY